MHYSKYRMSDNKLKGGKENMCQTYCISSSTHERNFLTKAEKVEMLKAYKQDLESEVKGVSEKINQLEKEND